MKNWGDRTIKKQQNTVNLIETVCLYYMWYGVVDFPVSAGGWWSYLLIAAAVLLLISIFFYLTCHLYKRSRCHCHTDKPTCSGARTCCHVTREHVTRCCWSPGCCRRCQLLKRLTLGRGRSKHDWHLPTHEYGDNLCPTAFFLNLNWKWIFVAYCHEMKSSLICYCHRQSGRTASRP